MFDDLERVCSVHPEYDRIVPGDLISSVLSSEAMTAFGSVAVWPQLRFKRFGENTAQLITFDPPHRLATENAIGIAISVIPITHRFDPAFAGAESGHLIEASENEFPIFCVLSTQIGWVWSTDITNRSSGQ